jgi:3-hydroxyacyl-CoA dehydrogenase
MTDKVAIVGAGLVGRAWAISFARGGHRVTLFDADDKAVVSALSTIESMLRTLELRGMLKGQTAADVRSRMTGAGSLEIALVPLHSGFDSLNLNLSWPELWDRRGPFWRGPFWL